LQLAASSGRKTPVDSDQNKTGGRREGENERRKDSELLTPKSNLRGKTKKGEEKKSR